MVSPGRGRPPGDAYRLGRARGARSTVVSFLFVVLLVFLVIAAMLMLNLL